MADTTALDNPCAITGSYPGPGGDSTASINVLNVDDTLRSAESLFQQTHLTSMVITDGKGQFVGSVSGKDLLGSARA